VIEDILRVAYDNLTLKTSVGMVKFYNGITTALKLYENSKSNTNRPNTTTTDSNVTNTNFDQTMLDRTTGDDTACDKQLRVNSSK